MTDEHLVHVRRVRDAAVTLTTCVLLGTSPCAAGPTPVADRPQPSTRDMEARNTGEADAAIAKSPGRTATDRAVPRERRLAPVKQMGYPLLPTVTPSMAQYFSAVSARSERRNDVFSKLGGSSVVSRAFLQCFAGKYVTLGEHQHLQPTIDFFRAQRVQGSNSFARQSLAARVGWSVRHGLGGRPSHVVKELQAAKPRFALALFGGNDVQGRNTFRFGSRLIELVELLERHGVFPVLGSTFPRKSKEMDAWSRRYNQVSRAVADAWSLPYIDFYRAAKPLPSQGLARDGVHPNVYRDGGRSRACDLSAEALERGQNLRNQMVLETLDRLRRSLLGDEHRSEPGTMDTRGAGSSEDPIVIDQLPFAERFDVSAMHRGSGAMRCSESEPTLDQGPTRARAYRMQVNQPLRLRFVSIGVRKKTHISLMRSPTKRSSASARSNTPEKSRCVQQMGHELAMDLSPGVWEIAVEIGHEEEIRRSVLFAVDRDPADGE